MSKSIIAVIGAIVAGTVIYSNPVSKKVNVYTLEPALYTLSADYAGKQSWVLDADSATMVAFADGTAPF
jgi:hypothetical protein